MADRFVKFTERARKVLTLAQEEAQRFNHNYIGTEHLLLGLIREGDGVAAHVLANMGVELSKVRTEVERIIGQGDRMAAGEIGLTPRAKKVIELTIDEARRLNHDYIGTEHLLLGLVREGEGIAANVLEGLGVGLDKVRAHVIHVLSQGPTASSPLRDSGQATPTLDRVGVDPTQAADARYLDWVFVWQKEVDRLIEILGRSSRNNPVLVGDIGSIKALIIQELARRLTSGDPPATLKSKRLAIVQIGALASGMILRSLNERRLRVVIDEVRRSQGRIIPVFDDIHLLVGSGAEGTWEEGNPLRTSLVQGNLQCIGSTRPDDFRALVEGDTALAGCFEAVEVAQPTIQETVAILRRAKSRYERHHGLEITDEALQAAAELAARHLPEGILPDRAIDLIDRAATLARRLSSGEAMSLKEATRHLPDALITLQAEKASAITSGQYELAAELRDREVKLREKIDRLERSAVDQTEPNRPRLTKDHIAEAVSELTGNPVLPPTGDA